MAKFQASTAPPEWAEMVEMAAACERSGLSAHQAAAARLGALGFGIAEIGQLLKLADYTAARRVVQHAAIRLERTEWEVREARVKERRLLLECMRRGRLREERTLFGVTPAHSQHTHLPSAKPFGTVAQDCLPDAHRKPLAFLRALYNVLSQPALSC